MLFGMGFVYESILRPYLFRMEPERAHEMARNLLMTASRVGFACNLAARVNQRTGAKPVEVAGLLFPNLVGMAAGMDKDGEFVPACFGLGFGHVEVGTVTPEGQPGNPHPRLFRYPEHEALVNRMGFNNHGARAMAEHLSALPAPGNRRGIVGVNIGKAKNTALEDAHLDYVRCLEELHRVADYITVNVSSPNTAGLRDLQREDRLTALLRTIREARDRTAGDRDGRWLPLFVKIAPDLDFRGVDAVLGAIEASGFNGIVATNTTIARPAAFPGIGESGGLSGRPVGQLSTAKIRYISQATGGRLPLIGVGGVVDAATAGEKCDAGAHLVQVYTGWVYRGPLFPREVAVALRRYQGGLWGEAGIRGAATGAS